jgi:hypothetical protein
MRQAILPIFTSFIFIFWPDSVRSEIVVQGYYRLGENDTGAVNGAAGQNPTNGQTGGTLNQFTPIPGNNTPQYFYTNNVSSTAATYTSSTLAMSFNGGNGFYYKAPVTAATNNWGIEGWFKVTNATNKQVLVSNGQTIAGSGSTPAGFGLMVEGGKAKGYFGGGPTFDPGFTITANQWFYLAMVRDNGVNKMYFNDSGTVLTGNNVANTAAQNTFSIGGVNNPTSTNYADDFFLTGAADEVRVFTIGAGGFNPATNLLYPQAVPEPGTLLLGGLAAACGGGGVWWKRRKRKTDEGALPAGETVV